MVRFRNRSGCFRRPDCIRRPTYKVFDSFLEITIYCRGDQLLYNVTFDIRFHSLKQGFPPVALGIITYFFLPSRPESTSFLTERERQIAVERMNRDASADRGAVINKGLSTITLSYLHEKHKCTPQLISSRLSVTGG